MLRTFNCGIGMVLVMPAIVVPHDGIVLGEVVAGDAPQIELPDDHWWL
jgi:phosphoribosylaminoimidazole (AIR) synthetase